MKDDWDFLWFLPSSLGFDSVIYSCDIENLYTSIPTDLCIKAIDYWITRKRNLIPVWFTKEFIIDSIKFILKNNNLFDSKMFNQVFGTTMGPKCAPPYACLTIEYREETRRPGAVVQRLSLLHNFSQLSLNSGSTQVQILLAVCQWFAMVRISDNGLCWK